MLLTLPFKEINRQIDEDNLEADEENPGGNQEIPHIDVTSAYDLVDQMEDGSTTDELFQAQCELAYTDDSAESWRAVVVLAMVRDTVDKVGGDFSITIDADGINLNTNGSDGKVLIGKNY